MRRLVCDQCGSSHYSASARSLLERGAVCENCGGPLELTGDEDSEPAAVGEEDAGRFQIG